MSIQTYYSPINIKLKHNDRTHDFAEFKSLSSNKNDSFNVLIYNYQMSSAFEYLQRWISKESDIDEFISNIFTLGDISKIYIKIYNGKIHKMWVVTNNYSKNEFDKISEAVLQFEYKNNYDIEYIYMDKSDLKNTPPSDHVYESKKHKQW